MVTSLGHHLLWPVSTKDGNRNIRSTFMERHERFVPMTGLSCSRVSSAGYELFGFSVRRNGLPCSPPIWLCPLGKLSSITAPGGRLKLVSKSWSGISEVPKPRPGIQWRFQTTWNSVWWPLHWLGCMPAGWRKLQAEGMLSKVATISPFPMYEGW